MNNSIRWAVLVGALLLACAVGFWSYQAGMAHGIEQSGKIVAPPPEAYPYPYPYYGWHRPWGFGFFFGPLFFLAFWLIVVRGLFWRRRYGYGRRLRARAAASTASRSGTGRLTRGKTRRARRGPPASGEDGPGRRRRAADRRRSWATTCGSPAST